jgi:Fic family protein
MLDLNGTPYVLDSNSMEQIYTRLKNIEERVSLLRNNRKLTPETLRDYYGEKRFEQVAESNAIEGNTLSTGETELAVLKGVTITGHDQAYTKDAIALDKALNRITELARNRVNPSDIEQLHEIHALLLGEHPGAGIFRNQKVIIRGAKHTPPKTWAEIIKQMEQWQNWSRSNPDLPAPIRATILHAWLAHIHPYIDGNGRTARAITNLELIRAGYPPIIIKRKERERYLESLGESDDAGDIRSFFELIFDRIESALTGLELSANRKQNYSPVIEKIRLSQMKQLQVWDASIQLLTAIIENNITSEIEPIGGACTIRTFHESLDIQDYIEVCSGRAVPRSWAFIIYVTVPGFPRFEKLAYVGHRSSQMYQNLDRQGGPSIYWSAKNPNGFPKWMPDDINSPFAQEITTLAGNGDEWYIRFNDGKIGVTQTTKLGKNIANAIVHQTTNLQ